MGHPVYQCLPTFLLNDTLKNMVKIPRHTKIMMLKKHCIRICGIYNFIYKHKQKVLSEPKATKIIYYYL